MTTRGALVAVCSPIDPRAREDNGGARHIGSTMEPAGETTYRVGWSQTFEPLEDPCGGLISWSAEAVT
jgi:hypothetical protein